MTATFQVGQRVQVKPASYNWHGNGAVGEITDIEASIIWVAFGLNPNGTRHSDWFNPEQLRAMSNDTPLGTCPPNSPCRCK